MRAELMKKVQALADAVKTRDEWKAVWKMLQTAARQESRGRAMEARRKFRVGDRVSFESRKYGRPVTGTILAVMETNIKVETDDDGKWTIHPTLLRKIDAEGRCEKCKHVHCTCVPGEED